MICFLLALRLHICFKAIIIMCSLVPNKLSKLHVTITVLSFLNQSIPIVLSKVINFRDQSDFSMNRTRTQGFTFNGMFGHKYSEFSATHSAELNHSSIFRIRLKNQL